MAIYIAKKKVAAPTLDGDASEANVLSGKTFYSDSTTKKTGSMTNNGAVSPSALSAGSSYTVPAGYHNGSGVVTTQTLAEQTGVDTGKTAIDSSHVLTGYQGWVNGTKVSGSYTPSSSNIQPSKSATAGTTAIDVTPDSGYDAMAKVVVSPTPSQSKSATPTTTAQTITPDSGKLLSSVSVGAIQTETKSDTPNVSTNKTVSPSSGKYLSQVTIQPLTHSGTYTPAANTAQNDMGAYHDKRYVNTSGMIVPSGAKSITANGTGIDVSSYATANVNVPAPTLDGDAVAGNVLSGKTFYSDSYTKQTGSITSKAAATYNTSSSDQTISAGQYLSGAQTIKAVTTENITAGNIKQGVTVKVGDANDDDRILSVTGTYTGGGGTPTETLLWQNSSPSTAISYTTVTLSESIQNFDYIKVVGQVNPSGDTTEIMALMPVAEFITIKESNTTTGTAFLLGYQKGSSERHYRLVYYVSNTQVKFSRSDAGTSGTSTRTMPYKIYGVKY